MSLNLFQYSDYLKQKYKTNIYGAYSIKNIIPGKIPSFTLLHLFLIFVDIESLV